MVWLLSKTEQSANKSDVTSQESNFIRDDVVVKTGFKLIPPLDITCGNYSVLTGF